MALRFSSLPGGRLENLRDRAAGSLLSALTSAGTVYRGRFTWNYSIQVGWGVRRVAMLSARRRSVDFGRINGMVFGRINGMQRKPPITLALLVAIVAVWVAPEILGDFHREVALCPARLMAGLDPPHWSILSTFVHADDGGWHLYYNMVALLAKGLVLEDSLGSERFAAMTALLVIGGTLVHIVLAYTLTMLLGVANTYHGCVVGFSGVLFGMSVIVTHSPQVARRYPMPPSAVHKFMPTLEVKHVVWVELILASLVQWNVSSGAHLSGLLTGLFYVHGAAVRQWLRLWLSHGALQIRQGLSRNTLAPPSICRTPGFAIGDTVDLRGLYPPHEHWDLNNSAGLIMGRRGVGDDQLQYIVLVDGVTEPVYLPPQYLVPVNQPRPGRRYGSVAVRGRSPSPAVPSRPSSRGRSPSPASSRRSVTTALRRRQDEEYAAALQADLAKQAEQQAPECQRNQNEQQSPHHDQLRTGQRVAYTDRSAGGTTYTVEIVHIERAVAVGEQPFYTVKLPNGTERQTEGRRLRPLSNSTGTGAQSTPSREEIMRQRRSARFSNQAAFGNR